MLAALVISLLFPSVTAWARESPIQLIKTTETEVFVRYDLDLEKKTALFNLVFNRPSNGIDTVAFGFSENGNYSESDVALVSLVTGKTTDAHTDYEGNVHTDAQQDWTLEHMEILETRTSIVLQRSWETCDTKADVAIEYGTTQLVVALSSRALIGQRLDEADVAKQITPVRLLPSNHLEHEPKEGLDETEVEILDVTVEDVRVPDKRTTYWCFVTQLPDMEDKQHVIEYEKLITPGNEGLVHHMEVFHCPEVLTDPEAMQYSGECAREPQQAKQCRKVLAAWAMGAETFVYPEEAGLAIGGPNFSPFVRIEIHYNNPTHMKGHIDSSGIRFHTTPNLRPFDAGVMELGLEYTAKMAIPPRQAGFALSGYCTADCTSVGIPPHGVTVFGSQLHAHLTGRQLWTRHIRDGIELPPLNKDLHFTSHWQEIRLINPTLILPGDSLITTCIFDTRGRENVTLGGNGIEDEMCVNYIHYYPRVDLEVCKSSVDSGALAEFFSGNKKNIRIGSRLYSVTMPLELATPETEYQSIAWSPEAVTQLRQLYREAPLSMQCNRSNGERFPGLWDEQLKPQVIFPYVAEDMCTE